MEPTSCSETAANKHYTPGINPKTIINLRKIATMHLQLMFTVVTAHFLHVSRQNNKYEVLNISICSGISNNNFNK